MEAIPSDDQEGWQAWIRWPASPPAAAIGHDALSLPHGEADPSSDSSATISFEDAQIVSPSLQPRQKALQDSENTTSSLNGVVTTSTAHFANTIHQPLDPASNRGVNRTNRKRRLAPRVTNASPLADDGRFVHYSPYGATEKASRTKRKLDKLETASYQETRADGACAACRLRNVRCSPATLDSCPRCLKNGIAKELCVRTKVKDLSTHRSIGLARAFVNAYEESVEEWYSEKTLLRVGHGFGDTFTIEIYQYKPKRAIIDVFWKEPSGWQRLEHRPFGINNHAHIDASVLDEYTRRKVPQILLQLPNDHSRDNTVFGDTMQAIQDYLHLSRGPFHLILRDALTLWGYMHLQYHALWQFAADVPDDDKLGMSELVLHSHDVQTLTPFHGTVPLPRLLHQQIHACCEGRMEQLDKAVLRRLEKAYRDFAKTRRKKPEQEREYALGLYLATWLYLTILEELNWDAHRWMKLLPDFNWPLERSPMEQSNYSAHAAQTVYAHYYAAMGGLTLWHPVTSDAPDCHASEKELSFGELVERLKTSDIDLEKQTAQVYSPDIRSLELTFSAMMLHDF